MSKALLIIVFALAAVSGYVQIRPAYSVVHDFREIQSTELNETRQILVHVPFGYQRNDRKYPVVYMLDGHTPNPEMMAGILANQSTAGKIPDLILVSIRNVDRTRDMTPTKPRGRNAGGGIAKFLNFIEKEVIPLVESNYRTEPYRIFAGHSLGGLAVVHTLINRPSLFDAYIAASPVLHWDKNHIIKQAKDVLSKTKLKKTIFLGLGNEPGYFSGWKSFQKVLKDSKGLEYEFQQYSDENHMSVVLPVYHQGLRKIFAGWEPEGNISIEELRSHYRALTKRFGYKVRPPEPYMNAAGYALIRARNLNKALGAFKENVANYPESANVYDSLGDCYERMGIKKKARENYKKSLEIATQEGNQRLIRTVKARLENLK
jgi:predicted alpha/beta superfamily hydrolase